MMIEIKHVNGSVLYTAETATDVRQALKEAVLAGANLAGANLACANLSRAYLSRAYLSRANLERANLSRAYLSRANLERANLACANLSRAYLSRANLEGANLEGANLAGAYLAGANLAGANLAGATGINSYAVNDLLILRDQPGKIRAYKLVTSEGYGPFNGGLKYDVGATVEVDNANTDETRDCADGINLATLPWCIREWHPGYRILLVEFTAKDIAAIPVGDGKFRVRKCKVIRELDLKEIGVVKA